MVGEADEGRTKMNIAVETKRRRVPAHENQHYIRRVERVVLQSGVLRNMWHQPAVRPGRLCDDFKLKFIGLRP